MKKKLKIIRTVELYPTERQKRAARSGISV
jgi:hypothetical protein